jgi:hypothetical protein
MFSKYDKALAKIETELMRTFDIHGGWPKEFTFDAEKAAARRARKKQQRRNAAPKLPCGLGDDDDEDGRT